MFFVYKLYDERQSKFLPESAKFIDDLIVEPLKNMDYKNKESLANVKHVLIECMSAVAMFPSYWYLEESSDFLSDLRKCIRSVDILQDLLVTSVDAVDLVQSRVSDILQGKSKNDPVDVEEINFILLLFSWKNNA